MNIEQIKVAGRYALTASSSAVAALVTFHLITAGDASNITTALNQIGSGLTSIIAGVTALIPLATAVYGMFRSSTTSQVAQVQASPDLQVVPLTQAGADLVRAAATPVTAAAVANKVPVIVAVLFAASTLAGCVNPLATVTNPVSTTNLYQAELVFDASLKTFNELKGLCAARVLPSTCRTYVVSGQRLIVKIAAADASARDFVDKNPTLNATNVVQAFTGLVSNFNTTVDSLSATKN